MPKKQLFHGPAAPVVRAVELWILIGKRNLIPLQLADDRGGLWTAKLRILINGAQKGSIVEYVSELRSGEVPYTVMVPQTQTRRVTVNEVRQELRSREVPYTEMVAQQRERLERVTEMFPYTIMVTKQV